jgi:hypothetical protein
VNSVVACFNEESGEWFLATVIEKTEKLWIWT